MKYLFLLNHMLFQTLNFSVEKTRLEFPYKQRFIVIMSSSKKVEYLAYCVLYYKTSEVFL